MWILSISLRPSTEMDVLHLSTLQLENGPGFTDREAAVGWDTGCQGWWPQTTGIRAEVYRVQQAKTVVG